MFNARELIDGYDYLIERPVIFKIIYDLMTYLEISPHTEIRYFGNELDSAQYRSTLGIDLTTISNRYPHRKNVKIEVTEDIEESDIGANPFFKREAPPCFRSISPNITVSPIYTPTLYTISVSMQETDKNSCNRWLNHMRDLIGRMLGTNFHTVQYHIPFPITTQSTLRTLYNLRQTVDVTDDNLYNQWFNNCLLQETTTLSNLSGSSSILVFKENQLDVQGQFSITGFPDKPERDEESELWSASFSYSVRFNKPIAHRISYPILIEQNQVPKELLVNHFSQGTRRFSARQPASVLAGNYLEPLVGNNSISTIGLISPKYDYFCPKEITLSSVRVFQMLLQMDMNDPSDVLNLKSLGNLRLQRSITDILTNFEYPYLTTEFESLFILTLYEDDLKCPSDQLMVDADLNVTTNRTLDVTKTYHLRLGMITDMKLLSASALARMRYQWDYATLIDILNAINDCIKNLGGHPDIKKNRLNIADLTLLNLPTYGAADTDGSLYSSSYDINNGNQTVSAKRTGNMLIEDLSINVKRNT